MLRFVLRRLLRGLATIWLVVTMVFVVLRLTGDPAQAMLPDDASAAQISSFRQRYGLDQSLPLQYGRYLANLARGDFGTSLSERRSVTELVLGRLGSTVLLALASLVLAVGLGIPAGVVAALKRGSVWDRLLMGSAFIGHAAPTFFLGIVLILVFSLRLRLLPSSGHGTWQHLVLPAVTLATGLLASIARMTRSSLLEVIQRDYVRVARSKGLSDQQVLLRHCFRNAAIPVLTMLGLTVGVMIGGAAITETVFAWPGVGRLAIAAISIRDYPVIQFIVILVAASVVAVNFAVDIAYGLLDPRIRQSA